MMVNCTLLASSTARAPGLQRQVKPAVPTRAVVKGPIRREWCEALSASGALAHQLYQDCGVSCGLYDTWGELTQAQRS